MDRPTNVVVGMVGGKTEDHVTLQPPKPFAQSTYTFFPVRMYYASLRTMQQCQHSTKLEI